MYLNIPVLTQMEVLWFLVLCIIWPFRWLWQQCSSKKMPATPRTAPAWKICQESIRQSIHDSLLWASTQDYTDMWTRDTFFAAWGIDKELVRPFIDTMAKFQREDGLIPLYIGRGNACCKMFCGQRPSGPVHAVYADAKTGDCPTDSCFQFIIMAYEIYPEQCKKAWDFMQSKVVDGLVYEHGLGTWQDTIKHKGHVAYTNILYYKAATLLYPGTARVILRQLVNKLWTGHYFKSSTTNGSFGSVDNALALLYDIAPAAQGIRNVLSKHTWTSPPNVVLDSSDKPFQWYDVYLPCYPIGNAEYHQSWGWSWVYLLVKRALGDTDLTSVNEIIQSYGSLYETYDKYGPVRRVLYNSQPHFSEACGIYLNIARKKLKATFKW